MSLSSIVKNSVRNISWQSQNLLIWFFILMRNH